MGATAAHRQNLQRITLTAAGLGLVIIALTLVLISWATRSIDTVDRAKEEALVQRGLDRSLERLVEDVNSATIWNDTVKALNGPPDLAWLQVNLGDYYADYMKHEVTLTYDTAGQLVLASRDSEPVPQAQEAAFAAAVAPLVAAARQASIAPARRAAYGFDAGFSRSAVVRVGQETWLVAVSTVVPEDDAVSRPAVDPVVVSGKPISSLIATLKSDLAISDARFAPVGAAGPADVTVRDSAGRPLGVIVWTPDFPGRRLQQDAVPVILAVLALLLAGALVLFRWVNRVTETLAANETALIEARDRAEAANDAKSRFLSNVSHELRTPLNGVVGMAEVMTAGELNPAQRENLTLLRQAAGNLTALIEQILQIARLERGEEPVKREVFVPAVVIVDAVEEHRAAAMTKTLKLECRVADLGVRKGDAGALRQVVSSLVRNAVAYTSEGEVRVQAAPSDDGLRIVVSDTGMGIAESLMPSLFGTFVQGDDSLTKTFAGTGLGLAICRRLVDTMNGRISVETIEGQGSRFIVDLPLAEATPALLAARTSAQPLSAAAANSTASPASTWPGSSSSTTADNRSDQLSLRAGDDSRADTDGSSLKPSKARPPFNGRMAAN